MISDSQRLPPELWSMILAQRTVDFLIKRMLNPVDKRKGRRIYIVLAHRKPICINVGNGEEQAKVISLTEDMRYLRCFEYCNLVHLNYVLNTYNTPDNLHCTLRNFPLKKIKRRR